MGFWEPLFFWILAIGAMGTSLAVLIFRNPLYSALALIVDFFCFAGLYILLSAHFLAVTQVLVYTGAIMVLFVFIIMLLNLSDEELGSRRFNLHQILAFLAGGALFVFSVGTIGSVIDQETVERNQEAADVSRHIQAQAGDIAHNLYRQKRQAAIEAAEGKEKRKLRRKPEATPPRTQVYLQTRTDVPGLYADLSEYAVRVEYRKKLQEWERGAATPADGKYRTFDPDEKFELPPALRPGVKAVGGEIQPRAERDQGNLFGTVEPIAILLVNRFVIPFELTAVLLLAGIIGAVIIAKKRL